VLRRITMKNLFVGNMSFQTTAEDLRALFEPFGQLARVHVATDRETGRARGFGFVEMPNDAEAAKAIAALDGKDVGGRNLKVNEARPKSESGGSGPRGPRGGTGGSGGGDRGGSGGKDDNRGNSGGPRGGNSGGGRKERFSNEDYREVARQPREPRW
jgi:RNA recognition motif-containing protein